MLKGINGTKGRKVFEKLRGQHIEVTYTSSKTMNYKQKSYINLGYWAIQMSINKICKNDFETE